MATPNSPAIIISRAKHEALSRILDSIPKGYVLWTQGSISSTKALQVANKFHLLYGIASTPAQRITRKRNGQANCLLVMYWPLEAERVEWVLLATQGAGLESEKLNRIDSKPPLSWMGYELVRYLGRGKIHWTWRRPKQAMADWYNLLSEQLNKKRMSSVGQTLQMIAHQPGFHGVREQSKALFAFAKQKGYVGELPFLFYQQKSSQGDRVALMTLGA